MSAVDYVVSSRPTITIAGQADAGVTQGLVYLRVDDSVDGLARCELQVGNWGLKSGSNDFLYFDRQTLEFGKELEVALAGSKVFAGRVSALEAGFPHAAPPVLTVLAEDRLLDLRRGRVTKLYENMSDSDIFSQIASDNGFTPAIDVNGPTHRSVVQHSETYLSFLRRRARRVGAEVWADGTTLHVATRASRSTGTPVQLGYGRELREFTATADVATQFTKVFVGGWAVDGKEAVAEQADDGDLGGETSSGDSGPSIMQSAGFKDRTDEINIEDALAPAVGATFTSAEAQAIAKARMLEYARRFVTARGVADAVAGLAVGAKVTVAGVGPLFEGEYYVTQVTHVFDAALGVRTEFGAERPWLGRAT
jgi:Bacteriophage probable baseplate hub protein